METAKETAMRVVSRLLDGDSGQARSDETPGNQDNNFEQLDSTLEDIDQRLEAKGSMSGKSVKKAWKQGKVSGAGSPGTGTVAKKPGKVSYTETLIARVQEKLAVKKAMKMGKVKGAGSPNGATVAKKPGKVSYKKESVRFAPQGRAGRMLESIVRRPQTI